MGWHGAPPAAARPNQGGRAAAPVMVIGCSGQPPPVAPCTAVASTEGVAVGVKPGSPRSWALISASRLPDPGRVQPHLRVVQQPVQLRQLGVHVTLAHGRMVPRPSRRGGWPRSGRSNVAKRGRLPGEALAAASPRRAPGGGTAGRAVARRRQTEEMMAGASAGFFAAGCAGLRKRSSPSGAAVGRRRAEQLHARGAGDRDHAPCRRGGQEAAHRALRAPAARAGPRHSARSRSSRKTARMPGTSRRTGGVCAAMPRRRHTASAIAFSWPARAAMTKTMPLRGSAVTARCASWPNWARSVAGSRAGRGRGRRPARRRASAGRASARPPRRNPGASRRSACRGDAVLQLGQPGRRRSAPRAASSSAGSGRDGRRARSAAPGSRGPPARTSRREIQQGHTAGASHRQPTIRQ